MIFGSSTFGELAFGELAAEGDIDVLRIPSSRIVVFEGSRRVVTFDGSRRVVQFHTGNSTLRTE